MKQNKPPDIDSDISLRFCFKIPKISLEQIQENWNKIRNSIDKMENERKNKERNSKP